MAKVFEDEFMDLISENVSLCTDLLEESNCSVDVIYIYMYDAKTNWMYNVFFQAGNKVLYLNDLGLPDRILFDFLDTGMEDIERLQKVCEKYDRPMPCQMKMVFKVKTRGFDAQYDYEDDPDKGPTTLFLEWGQEVERKLASM